LPERAHEQEHPTRNPLLVAVSGGITPWNAPNAFAGSCQNVEIHVHDDVYGDIKIVDNIVPPPE
jgi:hypothetical protein